MCLADFLSTYTYTQRGESQEAKNDEFPDGDEDEGDQPDELHSAGAFEIQRFPLVITLKDGLGRLQRRRVPAVLRWPSFSLHKDSEKYYRSRLMLFVPWRNEDQLSGNFDTYEERYQAELSVIHQIEAR